MSADQSHLRTMLLGSLLDAARYNRARGAGAVRVFEQGAVFLAAAGDEPLPSEPQHLGALLLGPVRPGTWRDPDPRPADFFTAKGVLTALMETLRVPFTVGAGSEPFLHPGRSADVLVDERAVGWLGEIHPLVAGGWDLSEIPALAAGPPMYVDVTSFPEVREDLAVIVPDTVSAAEVLAVVRRAAGRLLVAAEVFDVYRDPERVGAGRVSLALRLTFRGSDRTLTDAEVAERRAAITKALEGELGGTIRAA
jgi:phenylalanyl-tRNA synthetase beta chain